MLASRVVLSSYALSLPQETCTGLREQLAQAKLKLQDAQHTSDTRLAAARHAWAREKTAMEQQQEEQLAAQQQRHAQDTSQLKKRLKEARSTAKLQAEELIRLQIELTVLRDEQAKACTPEEQHAAAGTEQLDEMAVAELLAQAQDVRRRQEVYLRAADATVVAAS